MKTLNPNTVNLKNNNPRHMESWKYWNPNTGILKTLFRATRNHETRNRNTRNLKNTIPRKHENHKTLNPNTGNLKTTIRAKWNHKNTEP